MGKVKSKSKAKEAPPPQEKTESEGSTSSGEYDNGYGTPVRPRKRFSLEETRILEEEFKKNSRPTAEVKKRLAEDFNTVANRIQIWFQNRRAKEKKLSRPATNQGSEASSPASEKSDHISESDVQEESSQGNQIQHFRQNFQFFDQDIMASNTNNWPSRGVDPKVIFPYPNASVYSGMYPNNYMARPFVFGNPTAPVSHTASDVSRALGHQREDKDDEHHCLKKGDFHFLL